MSEQKMLTLTVAPGVEEFAARLNGGAKQIILASGKAKAFPPAIAYDILRQGNGKVIEVRDLPQEAEKADKRPAKKTDEKPAE